MGKDPLAILEAEFSLEQSRQTMAAEYGFSDWNAVYALGDATVDGDYERAVDTLLQGDIDMLSKQLKANPDLTHRRSKYGHQSTLLHYIGANGVESHRQVTPLNAAEIAQCLIDSGADVNAKADMYGGSTALGLVLTSAHPHNAGVVSALEAVLRNAGAHE